MLRVISESLPADNGLYIDNRIKEINTPTPDQFIRDTPDPPGGAEEESIFKKTRCRHCT